MEEISDALVLRSVDYKDNDRILTLFSAEKGKITAGIKGVRRSGARLRFASEPFAFCEYVLSEKGNRATVIGAVLHDGFYPVRENVEKYYCACSVLEVCSAVLPEGVKDGAFFLATLNAVKEIAYQDEKLALVKFLLSAIAFSGFMPEITTCGVCGGQLVFGKRAYFDLSTGKFSCEDCAVGVRVSAGTMELLKKFLSLPFHEEAISPDSPLRAIRLLKTYLHARAEIDFPTLNETIRMLTSETEGGNNG